MQLDEQRILGQDLPASLGSVVCNATSLHAYFLLAKRKNSWIWSYIPTYIIFFSCMSFHSFLHHMVFSHGFSLNLSTAKWLVYVNGWKNKLSNRWSYIDFDPSHCGYLLCMHPIFFELRVLICCLGSTTISAASTNYLCFISPSFFQVLATPKDRK